MDDGDTVSINYKNNLGEEVTMHGHGMHVPPSMDGTAHQIISQGATWSARYTVNQKACTNWYHPHTMNKTVEHVYKDLAGLIIIEDSESKNLDLPKRYGIDDIPLVLQDRNFNNGQIEYNPSMRDIMFGYIGDTFIVNGDIEPTLDVEAKEIRFRILNGSNSSIYELGFSDGRSFKQIATDNSFLGAPIQMTKLTLSPAERAEIVVDLNDSLNQKTILREFRHNKNFMTINIDKSATGITTLPDNLTTLSTAVRTRPFLLSGMMGSLRLYNGNVKIFVHQTLASSLLYYPLKLVQKIEILSLQP
jgi:FtsP/CotA-like multicopper oxidase with cupredoxin domain